jgi:acetyltransferase
MKQLMPGEFAQDLVIRRIRPDDTHRLVKGFSRLSANSVYQRFLTPKSRLTSSELRTLSEVDFADHYALVVLRRCEPDVLVGVGRWVRDATDRSRAELAIVLADALQGAGLGTRLAVMLADAARDRGITALTGTMLAENRPAHRMFARLGAKVEITGTGSVHDVVAHLCAREAGDTAGVRPALAA